MTNNIILRKKNTTYQKIIPTALTKKPVRYTGDVICVCQSSAKNNKQLYYQVFT